MTASWGAAAFFFLLFFTFFFTFFVFFVVALVAVLLIAVAWMGRPSAKSLVWSPKWLFASLPRPVAVMAYMSVVRRSVIQRSAPPMSW